MVNFKSDSGDKETSTAIEKYTQMRDKAKEVYNNIWQGEELPDRDE